MNGPADLVAEDRVHKLVLLYAREPVEPLRDDLGPEVVAPAGQVLDGRSRSRNCLFDALFQLLGARHCYTEDSGHPGG